MKPPAAACRLYCILARDGRSAVVFRRGPSKQVSLLRWWLGSDTIELGQWFKGRIYERRCDLNPDGSLLVYFAAKWSNPMATWTAVSRPPYLTALALWPKGDAWGGGGSFEGPRQLGLNHPAHQMHQKGEAPAPRALRVARYAEYAGAGEDNPLLHDRQSRDGWRMVQPGISGPYRSSGPAHWLFSEPERYERPQPETKVRSPKPGLVLRRDLVAIGEQQGRWYLEHYFVCDEAGRTVRALGACDWADWQKNGDLLVATGGKLYRLTAHACGETSSAALGGAVCVADLTELKFRAISPLAAARGWPPSGARRYLAGVPLPKPD